ncbi:GIY-YIG nuclease family protein [Photobacterium sp. DNB23_23_1]|uniref:GIY-YIG nuclease family protein n=1 Tax=Photobacterium pectinilyticum TaxID=2906793 RepID=A0ABT1N321_9GAMM|nr:GIY-YIG nuclease family protein [Photobacterium sp. ZSDE20]MCQ1059143.1 GIY-YIG nuclease family protein [Photobacterium sp. ZSDE20]MDD1824374.1 GIY-YIG nuclease family protein [Photobacterium sp. ZSDE20]
MTGTQHDQPKEIETESNKVGKWSVYLIRTAANQLYCGVTTDVERRFNEHQSSKRGAKFLKGKGPLQLSWSECVGDKRLAMQLEYRIKRLPKRTKEQIVAGCFSVFNLVEK